MVGFNPNKINPLKTEKVEMSLKSETDETKGSLEQKESPTAGVENVFKNNPELAIIGTPEEYSNYLKTIFPNSKLNQIFYHGTTDVDSLKKEGFLKERLVRSQGFNFIHDYEKAEGIALAQWELTGKEGVVSVVLNSNNIQTNNWNESATQEKQDDVDTLIVKNTPENSDYYVVFEPSQVHALGSDTDKEAFKSFVLKNTKTA